MVELLLNVMDDVQDMSRFTCPAGWLCHAWYIAFVDIYVAALCFNLFRGPGSTRRLYTLPESHLKCFERFDRIDRFVDAAPCKSSYILESPAGYLSNAVLSSPVSRLARRAWRRTREGAPGTPDKSTEKKGAPDT